MSAKEPFQRPSGAGILLSWATWTLLTPPEVTAPAIPMNPGLHMRGGARGSVLREQLKHVSLFHSVKPRLQEFYELEGLRAGNLVQPPHFEMRNPVASQI